MTPAKRRVIALMAGGSLVRRRGAFGTSHAQGDDQRFASSRTLDAMWRDGLIRPAETWGAFELANRSDET
jgi:hypothetical protein